MQFEEFAASVAKVAEKTRLEGSVIGNAYKSILARTSRSKSADEDISDEDRSNAAKALGQIGISVYDQNGEYQDFSKTLDELASKWDTLTDAQKANIGEAMAGTRQLNTLNAIITTWQDAKSLASDALTDTDFAMQNQEKHMESMQAKLNTLKASLQDFWNSFLDTGVLNTGIEALTLLTKGLEGLINLFKGIGDILPVVNGEFTTLAGTITTVALAYKTFENIKTADSVSSGLKKTGKDILSLFDTLKIYKEYFKDGFFVGFNDAFVKTGNMSASFFGGIVEGSKSAINAMSPMTKTLLGIGAAAAAIYIGVKAFDAFTTSVKETEEAMKKAKDEAESQRNQLQQNKQTIIDIGSEFEKLSKGIDPTTKENISLTSDEYERYHDICNQIADMYPDLVKSFDEQGNAILTLKGKASELNAEYEKMAQQQARQRWQENAETYAKNFNDKTGNKGFWDQLADAFSGGDYAEIYGEEEAVKLLEKVKNFTYEEIIPYTNKNQAGVAGAISKYLQDTLGISSEMTEDEWKNIRTNIPSYINTLNEEIKSATTDAKSIMQDYLTSITMGDGKYADLDDSVISKVSTLISNMSTDQIKEFDGNTQEMSATIDKWISKLSENPDAQLSMDKLLSIDENTNIEDMKSIIEENLDTLAKALDYDDEAKLKVQLDLEDTDDLIKQYDKTISDISRDIKTNEIKSDLTNLLGSESNAGMYFKTLESYYKKQSLLNAVKLPYNNDILTYNNIDAYQKSSKDGSRTVVLTPVLPDGTVLSQESLEEYANSLLEGKSIEPDIVLNTFEGKDSAKQAEKFRKSIEKASKKYKELKVSSDQVKDFIKQQNINTADELALLQQCVNETDTWNEAMEKYITKSVDVEVGQKELEQLEKNLETVEENIDNINEAIDASNTSIGLSKEQIDNIVTAFEGLDDFDYDKLFESTAEGVHLNVTEVEKLTKAYENMEGKKYSDEIDTLRDRYARLCIQIQETADPLEKNKLIMEKTDLSKQIDQAQELQSRYEGLTNAVTKWQKARDGSEAGDVYDEITQGFEDAQKLFENHQVGTREFKSFTQMLTDEDLTGKDPSYYAEVYAKRMSKVKKYFTESDEGAYQFFVDLDKINDAFVDIDKNGNLKNININIAEAAKALGVSEALVTEIFKKAGDFGAVLTFKEESEDLKTFREEAEKASDVLKDLNDNDKIDITVDSKEELKKEIDKGKELISNLEEQKKKFEDAGDTGSEAYKKICTQLDATNTQLKYVTAKLGDMEESEIVIDIHSEEGIEELNNSIKEINKLKDINLEINWANKDPEYYKEQIKEVTSAIQELPKKDGKIDMSVEGAKECFQVLYGLIQAKQEASKDIILDIDTSELEEETKQAVEYLQKVEMAANDLANKQAMVKAGFDVDTSSAEQALVDAKNDLVKNSPSIVQSLKVEGIDLDQAQTAADIQSKLSAIDAKVLATIDPSLVDGYIEEEKTGVGTILWDNDTNKIDDYVSTTKYAQGIVQWGNYTNNVKKSFTASGTVNWTNGDHDVNGNVNFGGSSFAGGTVGASKDEVALIGEEDPELWVDRDTGRWQLIGQNGAEFRKISKGDLIFNADQTKMLLKNGKINSRGRSFLNGTINNLNSLFRIGGKSYAGGTETGGWNRGTIHTIVKNATSNKSNNSKEKDEFLETLDWIEVWIDRIERKIQNLDTVANSVYKSFSKRNSTLGEEYSAVTEEIYRQQKAYEAYTAKANSLGLSSSYMNKIWNGTLKIEDFTNEDLYDKIQQAQDYADAALDARDALVDLKEQLGDIVQAKFDNVVSEFDYAIDEIEHRINKVETGLDLVEAKGNFASKEYFTMLLDTEKENIDKLAAKYSAVSKAYNEAMSTGAIEKNSEAQKEMLQEIRDIEEAWQDAKLSYQEYVNEMREMNWEIFDKQNEYISEITKESEFLVDLLSFNENDMFSKKSGKLTDVGQSVGGLYAMNYNVYMKQADDYRKKIEEVNRDLANDPYNTILIDKKNEYLEAQREAIRNANDEKMAIRDLIEESYNRMLDILQKLIDKRKEYLEVERDLYSYEKNVREQTKQITDYQKQLTALRGDNSEETQSRRQQLQDSLEKAQSDLQETEYDQWLSDQEKLLDDLYSDYEELLNERLDNIDGLFMDMIDSTNANAETIGNTINDATTNVGYQITEEMQGIWSSDSGLNKIVSEYNTNFSNTMTTTNKYVQGIYDLINKTVNKSKEEVKTNTTAKPTSSGSSSTSSGSSSGSSSSSSSSSNSGNSSAKAKLEALMTYKKDSYPKSKLNINTSIVD